MTIKSKIGDFMMDIGDVLSRALKTIWKHKILWIFGFLAGCSSAANYAGSNSGYRFSSGDIEGFYNNFRWEWTIIGLALLCLTLIFYFLLIFLGAIGRIGLTRGTQLVDGGREKLNFGELFNESMPYFWRVFGLTLLVFLGMFFIGIPLSIITCGIGAIILAIVVPVLLELSVIAIVVDDVGILDGLKRGWDVFSGNLGTMILLWLILVVGVGLVLIFIVGIPIALWLTPVTIVTGTGALQGSEIGTILSILCLVTFIPVLLVVIGIVRSFVTSAWTLTYLELTGQSSKPAPALPPEEPQPPQPPEPEEPLPDPL
jgi:hypothetical protein